MEILVVAHGRYAEGLLSSAELIAGKPNNLSAINFLDGMSQDDVKEKIKKYLADKEKALILVDLLGGTPFKMASRLASEFPDKTLNVVTGVNLNMILEAVFSDEDAQENLDILTHNVKEASVSGIEDLKSILNPSMDDAAFEGGI